MKWISIEEKIPDKEGYLLILRNGKMDVARCVTGTLTNIMNVCGWQCIKDATHWINIEDIRVCTAQCAVSFEAGFEEGVRSTKKAIAKYTKDLEMELD